MAKLPVWNDIIAEAYPAPFEDPSLPPDTSVTEKQISRMKKTTQQEANTSSVVLATPGSKVQVPDPQTKKFVPATINQVTKSANGAQAAVVTTQRGTKQTVPPRYLSMSESEMTPAQLKKREKIVRSMKHKIQDLKDRYGKRWKEVLYATATKMAMKSEDTGPFLPGRFGGHGSAAGIGGEYRDIQSETMHRILEALTFDAAATEAAEPKEKPIDADAKPTTDTPDMKRQAPEDKPVQKKVAPKDPAADTKEPSASYVLYRYNPTLGWSPHFLNPAKDGALESPVYSTLDDAKKAYRRNSSQSPKSISYRLREVSPAQGAKIHAKFEELGKTLGYDTIKEDHREDPVVLPMQFKAAFAIAQALGHDVLTKKASGESPTDILNATLKVWAKGDHTPETLRVAADMLRTATRMGINWDKKIIGNKLKDYLGEATNSQTHWSRQWQYGADKPVTQFTRWKTACGSWATDKEMSIAPTCPKCARLAPVDDEDDDREPPVFGGTRDERRGIR